MKPLDGKPPQRMGALRDHVTVHAYGVRRLDDSDAACGDTAPFPTMAIARVVAAHFEALGVKVVCEPAVWCAELDEVLDWHYRWGLDDAAAALVGQAQ